MKQIRLFSGLFTVGFWTLTSRILGFLREILLTAYVGPGPVMDAFVAAFRLPNMFRRFFAEGAFNAAFVPMFSKRLEGGDNAEGFAQDAFNLLAIAVLALVGLAMVFMPALVWITAAGFSGAERFDLAVDYGYVGFPYILFLSLAPSVSGWRPSARAFASAPGCRNSAPRCAIWCASLFRQRWRWGSRRSIWWSVSWWRQKQKRRSAGCSPQTAFTNCRWA